jgi:hypothetical protein
VGRVVRKREGVEQVRIAVKGLDGTTGKVGYFETAKYPDGTPVAYVAAIQEFGAQEQGIPARPTMRPTIAAQSSEWSRQFGAGARAVVNGRATAVQVMGAVGMLAAGDVAKAVAALTAPPLAEATIDKRRSRYADKNKTGNLSKPLVDTSIMVGSITHAVETGGGGP